MLNPDPEIEMLEMLRFEFPVFFRVSSCAADVPIWTLPKLRLGLLGARAASVGGGAELPLDVVGIAELSRNSSVDVGRSLDADVLPADCLADPRQPNVLSVTAIKVNAKISLRASASLGDFGLFKASTFLIMSTVARIRVEIVEDDWTMVQNSYGRKVSKKWWSRIDALLAKPGSLTSILEC